VNRRAPALAAVGVAIAGCSMIPVPSPAPPGSVAVPDLRERRAAWEASGIDDYDLRLTFLCECSLSGPVDVSVRGGVPVRATTERGPIPRDGLVIHPLTIERLYTDAIRTLATGGTVDATWDATGLLTMLHIEPSPNAIDDELDVTIDRLMPAS
jgi:hypothetical protein